ncbi:MAG: hypothetical protein ABI401_00795 [Candidatus Dormibacter sp.]
MPALWKTVLIGGEVTVLAAFTGVGLHLALQPHRPSLRPPTPILIPVGSPPEAAAPRATVTATPATPSAAPRPTGVSADWVDRLGHADRNLLASQWDILERLIGGMERYLRERVVPQMEHRR